MPHARIVFDLDSLDCVMLIISLGDPSACRLAHLVSCLVLLAVCISVLHTDATLPSFELNFALNEIWIYIYLALSIWLFRRNRVVSV